MKKFLFALLAVLTISICFTACDGPAVWDELNENDVDSSWCSGTWEGKFTTTVTGQDPVTIDPFTTSLTPAWVKTEIKFEGSIGFGSARIERTSTVKANKVRTKLYIKTTSTVGIGDNSITTTEVYNLEKK